MSKPLDTQELPPCLIPLSRGLFATVDADKFDWLNERKWYAAKGKRGRFYAVSSERCPETGKYRSVLMHRQVLSLQKGDPRLGDHINSDETLDNRISNLRIANHQQNAQNSVGKGNSASPLKGVQHAKGENKEWFTSIRVNGKNVYLGSFYTQEEAHAVYKAAAAKYHGDFLNQTLRTEEPA